MSNEKVPTPPVKKETILSGTYQQLLYYFVERLMSRDEAEDRIATIQATLHPGEEKTFSDFEMAWSLDRSNIETQLTNLRDSQECQVELGVFGAIFFMRYLGIRALVDHLPQATIGVVKQFVLIRPDDWYDKAIKGLKP